MHRSFKSCLSATVAPLLILVGANSAHAGFTTFDRCQVANFGYWFGSAYGSLSATNAPYQPPYDGGQGPTMGLLGGEQDEGFIEIDVTSLPERQHYYLEVSPVSVYAFTGIPQFNPWSLNVYHYAGDGLVTEADRGQGEFLARVSITEPGGAWYSQNELGGYYGDSHVDITSIVIEARVAGQRFVGMRYGATMDPWTPTFRGLLRAPVVLATDSTIPAPSAAPLLALAGLTARSRRRR